MSPSRLLALALLCAACGDPSRAAPDLSAASDLAGVAGPDLAELDPFVRPRATVDQPDDEPDAWQVHLVYAEPSDRVASPALDTNGELRRSIHAMNAWLALQIGGPRLRFDEHQGALDITFVKLPFPEAQMAQGTGLSPSGPFATRERVEAALSPTFADPKKLYLVFYDGLNFGTCGNSRLPGRFPVVYVGGVWRTTFLTAAASAGAGSVVAYDPAALDVPSPPFAAKLGQEAVTVTSVSGTTVGLAAPLASAHPAGDVLLPDSRPPDCRDNPRSSDGDALGYEDFTVLHELMHSIGIVAASAPDYAPPPTAGGHLADTGGGGTADLMYQGAQAWGCGTPAASAATSPCRLDPSHRNYYALPAMSPLIDLGRSVFLTPTPADATQPPAGF